MAWKGESGTPAWLCERMAGHLDAPALDVQGAALTYRDLLDEVDEVARSLPAYLQPRTAALLMAPRAIPDTVVLLLALWQRELTVVLADESASEPRLRELLAALPPAVVLRPVSSDDATGDDDVHTRRGRWRATRCTASRAFPYDCPDPAYVIPTSGSTGTPKLVLCRHVGLSRMSDALAARYGYGPGGRVLQFAPASYDAMIADTVVPLSAGATLVFTALDEPPHPRQISDSIVASRVTHVTLPPTVLRRLDDLHAPETTIVSAGEALDGALAETLLGRCRRLINAYGPCEATIAATAFDVTTETLADQVPIGRPLPGVDVRVDPLPDLAADDGDVPGMISIEGPTVAWGYVTGDRLAESSVPGFARDRRFVTGDLARLTDAGDLVFAGRVDRQVKRWGHRVELGAIETRIRGLAGVTDCAVAADGAELHAFVVSTRSAQDLADDLRGVLPRHEQPTHWHPGEVLPTLASDKARAVSVAAQATAGDFANRQLVALWEQFLGPPEGREADALSAGGDSMAIVMLLGAISEELGLNVEIADFMERPTLGALDERLAS